MTRKEILDTALKCVNGERDAQYGNPENNFQTIANFWMIYLSSRRGGDCIVDITPEDVAAMLALLKVSRIASGQAKDDNWIDLAGYAACGGEIQASHSAKIM
jgi:hypothetical protein